MTPERVSSDPPAGARMTADRVTAQVASLLLGYPDETLLGRLPMLRGGLVSAFLLALVEIMKELPVIALLRPAGWETLAARVFATAAAGEWQQAALPALALVLLVLAGLLPVIFLACDAENRHA